MTGREPTGLSTPSSMAMFLEIPLEVAIVVIIGLTPEASGRVEASATQRFLVPQTRPSGSRAPFRGLEDSLQEPI